MESRRKALDKFRASRAEPEPAEEAEPEAISPLLDWIPEAIPKYQSPNHLRRLTDVIERAAHEPLRVLVSTPPRHTKTETLIGGLVWYMKQFPELTSAYVSYGQRQANSKSRKIRRLARAVGIGLSDDMANMAEWRTQEGGGLLSTGIGGPLTGQGVDGLMAIDDPIKNREDAESTIKREAAWDWFTDVAYTRLEGNSSCLVVATRWHEDDLIGRLMKLDPKWEVINLPAINDGSDPTREIGEALWPERFSVEKLEAIRKVVGEYTWWSLYQGSPRPKGDKLFPEPVRYPLVNYAGARIVIGVDPAATAKTKADYTAIVVLAVWGTGENMRADVLEVLRFQKEIPEACDELEALQKRYAGAPIVVECVGAFKAVPQTLRRLNPRLRVVEWVPIGDKFVRAQTASAAWKAGRIRVPMAAPWVLDFLNEIGLFTGMGDKQDDQADAMVHAWNYAEKMPTQLKIKQPLGGGRSSMDGW